MYFSLPASIRLGYALQASSPFCWLPKSSGIIYIGALPYPCCYAVGPYVAFAFAKV